MISKRSARIYKFHRSCCSSGENVLVDSTHLQLDNSCEFTRWLEGVGDELILVSEMHAIKGIVEMENGPRCLDHSLTQHGNRTGKLRRELNWCLLLSGWPRYYLRKYDATIL